MVGWWVGWVGGVVLVWFVGWWFGVLVGCFVVVWCCLPGGWLCFVRLVGWWSCGLFVSVLLVFCWVCFASLLSSLCAPVFASVCLFALVASGIVICRWQVTRIKLRSCVGSSWLHQVHLTTSPPTSPPHLTDHFTDRRTPNLRAPPRRATLYTSPPSNLHSGLYHNV